MLQKLLKIFRKSNIKDRSFLLDYLPEQSVGAEIGVWKGGFTKQILEAVNPKELFLIDPYAYQPSYTSAWYGKPELDQGKMDAIFEETKTNLEAISDDVNLHFLREDSTKAHQKINEETLDWVYIDGNHTYEFVKKDLLNFYPKVKVGGYITGDDYGLQGWWDNGVKKAVDEFIQENTDQIEVLELKEEQFVIRRTS
jgi:hypothetical protein